MLSKRGHLSERWKNQKGGGGERERHTHTPTQTEREKDRQRQSFVRFLKKIVPGCK